MFCLVIPVCDNNECKGLLGAFKDMLSKIKEDDNDEGGGGGEDWSEELPMTFASMMGNKTLESPIQTPDRLDYSKRLDGNYCTCWFLFIHLSGQ
jgi:hypothetical protein